MRLFKSVAKISSTQILYTKESQLLQAQVIYLHDIRNNLIQLLIRNWQVKHASSNRHPRRCCNVRSEIHSILAIVELLKPSSINTLNWDWEMKNDGLPGVPWWTRVTVDRVVSLARSPSSRDSSTRFLNRVSFWWMSENNSLISSYNSDGPLLSDNCSARLRNDSNIWRWSSPR